MKRLIMVLAILVLILVLLPAGSAQAKKPLDGSTSYTFMGLSGILDGEGRPLIWEGPITGEIAGTIRWYAASEMHYTGQASHYDVVWEIVDAGDNVILAGEDSGSTTARHGKNSNWRTNGIVTVASDPYSEWLGRHVHMGGNFTWVMPGLPEQGTGYFFVG